jgi:ElaB/YqjD/DUF883 family membrane-anchored ribosome-binding protein
MTSSGHKDRKDNGTTTDRFAAKAHETVDSIAERAERAERQVRGAAERTAERAATYLESAPLAVLGLAFVAGVLLSTMVRR